MIPITLDAFGAKNKDKLNLWSWLFHNHIDPK